MGERLVEALERIRKEEGLSEQAFCRKLGISRVYWYFLKHGKRRVGMKLIRAVLSNYPQFTGEILSFLLVNSTEVKEKLYSRK